MAVTVKIDDKKKKAKAKPAPGQPAAPPVEGLDDFLLPQEKTEGLKALGIWLGIMAFLCLPCWIWEETHPWATGMTLWGIIPSLLYLFVLPFFTLRRLRNAGDDTEISLKTNERLKKLMQKVSGILEIGEPEGFYEPEGAARIFSLPGTVVVRKPVEKILEPDEVNCLVVRAMVEIRAGQARRLAVIHLMEETAPAVRILMWPVIIYTKILRAMWYPVAQKNADRLSLLLIKNTKLLVSAIVKEHAANDANMQELNVTTQDVTNWINQAGHIGMAGEEISIQYKLGRAIHEDPEFEDRIQALQKWGDSAQFKEALQKLAAQRSQNAPAAR